MLFFSLSAYAAGLICGSLDRTSKPCPMLAWARVLLAAPLLLATAASAQTATLIESLPFFADGFVSSEEPETFTLVPAEMSERHRPKAGGLTTGRAGCLDLHALVNSWI